MSEEKLSELEYELNTAKHEVAGLESEVDELSDKVSNLETAVEELISVLRDSGIDNAALDAVIENHLK